MTKDFIIGFISGGTSMIMVAMILLFNREWWDN
jgi:hypothetical protein